MTTITPSMPQTADRWEVVELPFETEQDVSQPFDEEFGAVWSQADGSRLDVPGFYDGDNRWLLRFCPPSAGEWSYHTYSSLPELSGHRGTLTVAENKDTRQHGPIQISAQNRQKFAYADGTPYFLMAFELDWLFALDADNPDDIPRTREIVETVAANGFSQIVMNVFAYDADWGEQDKIPSGQNFARPQAFPFGGSNDEPDHSTLDVEFFQRFDRVIEHLNAQGIVSHLMIYVWNKKVNWPEIGSQADNRYFDYVVKRYAAYPNIIWNIAKEAMGHGHDDRSYITERIARLRRLDAHERLVTVHEYNYIEVFPDKVDFVAIQEWTPHLYERMLEVKTTHPDQPILAIELGSYEKTLPITLFDGAYTDPVAILDRVYQCVFAGVYATYYWQNTAWYQVHYQPFSLPPEQQPHFAYYRNLRQLVDTYAFDTLVPLRRPFAPPALTDGDKRYLFYLTPNRRGIYSTVRDLTNQTVKIVWFDPLSGHAREGGLETVDGDGWLQVQRPAEIASPTVVAILEVQ